MDVVRADVGGPEGPAVVIGDLLNALKDGQAARVVKEVWGCGRHRLLGGAREMGGETGQWGVELVLVAGDVTGTAGKAGTVAGPGEEIGERGARDVQDE